MPPLPLAANAPVSSIRHTQQHRRAYPSLEKVRTFFSSFGEAPVSLSEVDPLTSRAAQITLGSGAVVYDALFLTPAEQVGFASSAICEGQGRRAGCSAAHDPLLDQRTYPNASHNAPYNPSKKAANGGT